MKISKQCFDMIKQFEGIRLNAYKAVPSEQYYTIGIGHYGPDVSKDMVITEQEAEDMFRNDVERFEKYVNNLGLPLNQNQFAALVSFTYNC
jgi:GH24 family phage-related lysozyme (muramidase)